MRMISAAVILAGMTFGVPAMADDCENAQSQTDMTECAAKALQHADAKLNAHYKEIEGRLKDDAPTRKLLVSAQRAWIAYRDAECTFQPSGAEGGSAYPMLVASCKAGLTTERAKALEDYLHCQEGDLSCPVPAGG